MKLLSTLATGFVAMTLILSANAVLGQEAGTLSAGVFSDTQAARGASVYSASCESCHAADLRGNSNAPSLLGMSFMFLWEGRSLEEFFVTIQKTMPSENPESLPPQSYIDVVSYILQANNFPAGPTELQAELDILRQIQITGH
ncbi:MAG: c-type cytochrome [Gammaproteobacteria bacterium]